ncbi:hypothetical protein FO519_005741 [Halicephalobus sp. NKZ332]|nr:hypothetical protein FO519_005741 [Halicephalobus sp. NKZ332]
MGDKAKVVVAGDACVGKTALLSRFLFNLFSPDYNFTVGIDFHSKAVVTESGENVRLQLWDTAGQERFLALLPSYLRDCFVVLIVFDLTSRKSFEGIPFWIDYVKRHSLNKSEIVLVGTKKDLANERAIEKTEAEILAKKNNIVFHEVSAVTGDGVERLFQNTGEIVLEVLKKKRDSVVGIKIDDSGYTSFSENGLDGKKPFFKQCCSG